MELSAKAVKTEYWIVPYIRHRMEYHMNNVLNTRLGQFVNVNYTDKD